MFASFETWRAAKADDLAADTPLINCPKCDGEGECIKECDECGHETESECQCCDGQGKVHFNDLDAKAWSGLFTHHAYFKELVEVSHDLSSHCGRDFFDLMCDAVKVSDRASLGRFA